MYYIGIDLGTSAVKLLLMDETGSIANIVSREYPIAFPHPGWSEQDPADWWAAVCDGIPALLDGFDASQVKGIGAGGQMHGLVVLDKNDAVIRPCILWNDGRTQKQVDYLNSVIGKGKLSRYTANIAFAGFTAPKLLWLRENEPDNFARIEKIMLPKDYINYKLTGVHCTDYSDASGMLLLDVEHKCWSREMLDICSVAETQLPKLFESWQPVGTLTAETAAKLGLPADVVVCAGAGDNAAAAVGCGAVGGGKCNISLGTSGTVFVTSDTFGVDKQNALHCFAHADGGYHLMGCILSAASCNKWWNEEVLHTTDYAAEQTPITADKLGTNDVYFLPYLMGERSPHNAGVLRHDPADFAQRVFVEPGAECRICSVRASRHSQPCRLHPHLPDSVADRRCIERVVGSSRCYGRQAAGKEGLRCRLRGCPTHYADRVGRCHRRSLAAGTVCGRIHQSVPRGR